LLVRRKKKQMVNFVYSWGLGSLEPQQVLPVVCTQGETCSTICDVSGAYLRAERVIRERP
ncbi:MAG: hypothetical protein PHX08_24165, partial [Lachnospiraceae bacterium]|nr:hypothetical protein [Lachnospiraceae bacterium]